MGAGSTLPQGGQVLAELFEAVQRGILPLEHACQRAGEAGRDGRVGAAAISTVAEIAFRRAPSDWRSSWNLVCLVHAAADAAWTATQDAGGDREVGQAFAQACADLVTVAHSGLTEAGDIRLFRTAREVAERGLAVARELRLDRTQGVMLQRRGSLVLDCYTANRTSNNHANEFEAWVSRATDTRDPDLISAMSTPGARPPDVPVRQWPAPLEAMDLAERDLRAALELVGPQRRGRVLKALAQTLVWRGIFGGPPGGAELVAVCEEALSALPPDDVESRLSVKAILDYERREESGGGKRPRRLRPLLRRRGQRGEVAERLDEDAERLIRRMETDWEDVLTTAGPDDAWDAVTQAVGLLAEPDPQRALLLLQRQRGLAEQWAREEPRHRHHALTVDLVARSLAPLRLRARIWRGAGDFDAVAAHVLDAARRRSMSTEAIGGALSLVMLASTKFNREQVGIEAAQLLPEAAPELSDRYADSYRDLVANLAIGEGVNREQAQDYTTAVSYHLLAADLFRQQGMAGRMVTALRYVADLVADGGVGNGGLSNVTEVSAWTGAHALQVELLAPRSGPPVLQRLVRVVLAHQIRHGTSFEELMVLLQAAKGRRFAAILERGTAGWRWEPEVDALLAEEARLEAALPAAQSPLQVPHWEAGLDVEDLVTAYTSDYETSPSDTPEGALTNVRRAVERLVIGGLSAAEPEAASPVSLEALRAALRPQTALLQMFVGQWVDHAVAIYALLVTKQRAYVFAAREEFPFPVVPIGLEHGGREVHVPPDGLVVASVRRCVQDEPAPWPLTDEAADELDGIGRSRLGVVYDHLDELAAEGITHLLVVPHGASHFLPLHLAGPPGQPIADRFVVTYLSNLAQLTTRAAPPRAAGTAVFALGYGDQPGMPYLASSELEARAIADVVGVEPVLDSAVTEPVFIAALRSARRVHLRAHGKHDVDAPLFQTVFVAPSTGHDGRLRAYEILPLDLDGLELVTLSACETALGRTDESDNLRGLPAALLLAGAQAIIGTLWPVSDVASSAFFVELYRRLDAGGTELVDAFGDAQRETRRRFPEYRDWGAFYMIGGYGTNRRTG